MSRKDFWILPALLLLSVAVSAGYTQPVPVEIDFDGQFAHGDLSSARHSDNEFEHIGCGIRVFETGVGDEVTYYGFCQARLEEEVNVVCTTFNKNLLNAIKAISDHSYVTFSWSDDGTGNLTCTRIGNSTQSFYLPLNKDAKKN